MYVLPLSRCALQSWCNSSMLIPIGTVQATCLPAFNAAMMAMPSRAGVRTEERAAGRGTSAARSPLSR